VQGEKSAVLLDTGLGVANIRSVAEDLTDKPLLVVNSHYHFDHTGGGAYIQRMTGAKAIMHRDDWEIYLRSSGRGGRGGRGATPDAPPPPAEPVRKWNVTSMPPME